MVDTNRTTNAPVLRGGYGEPGRANNINNDEEQRQLEKGKAPMPDSEVQQGEDENVNDSIVDNMESLCHLQCGLCKQMEKEQPSSRPPSIKMSRTKKFQRINSKILKAMLHMIDLGAKGFAYGIITEEGKTVTASSDTLRGWWKEEIRFQQAGMIALTEFEGKNLNTDDGDREETPPASPLADELFKLSDLILASMLSTLMQKCEPPQRQFRLDLRVPPPWWPTGNEDWWPELGEHGKVGEPAYRKPHDLRKASKVVVLVAVIKHIVPDFARITRSLKGTKSIRDNLSSKEAAVWDAAMMQERDKYVMMHPDGPEPTKVVLLNSFDEVPQYLAGGGNHNQEYGKRKKGAAGEVSTTTEADDKDNAKRRLDIFKNDKCKELCDPASKHDATHHQAGGSDTSGTSSLVQPVTANFPSTSPLGFTNVQPSSSSGLHPPHSGFLNASQPAPQAAYNMGHNRKFIVQCNFPNTLPQAAATDNFAGTSQQQGAVNDTSFGHLPTPFATGNNMYGRNNHEADSSYAFANASTKQHNTGMMVIADLATNAQEIMFGGNNHQAGSSNDFANASMTQHNTGTMATADPAANVQGNMYGRGNHEAGSSNAFANAAVMQHNAGMMTTIDPAANAQGSSYPGNGHGVGSGNSFANADSTMQPSMGMMTVDHSVNAQGNNYSGINHAASNSSLFSRANMTQPNTSKAVYVQGNGYGVLNNHGVGGSNFSATASSRTQPNTGMMTAGQATTTLSSRYRVGNCIVGTRNFFAALGLKQPNTGTTTSLDKAVNAQPARYGGMRNDHEAGSSNLAAVGMEKNTGMMTVDPVVNVQGSSYGGNQYCGAGSSNSFAHAGMMQPSPGMMTLDRSVNAQGNIHRADVPNFTNAGMMQRNMGAMAVDRSADAQGNNYGGSSSILTVGMMQPNTGTMTVDHAAIAQGNIYGGNNSVADSGKYFATSGMAQPNSGMTSLDQATNAQGNIYGGTGHGAGSTIFSTAGMMQPDTSMMTFAHRGNGNFGAVGVTQPNTGKMAVDQAVDAQGNVYGGVDNGAGGSGYFATAGMAQLDTGMMPAHQAGNVDNLGMMSSDQNANVAQATGTSNQTADAAQKNAGTANASDQHIWIGNMRFTAEEFGEILHAMSK